MANVLALAVMGSAAACSDSAQTAKGPGGTEADPVAAAGQSGGPPAADPTPVEQPPGAAEPAPTGTKDAGAQQAPATPDSGGQSADPAVADGGAAAAEDSAAGAAPGTAPVLPPIDDPGSTGPFEIEVTESLAGLSTHILIAPRDLGRGGIKHPVLVWINGAGANSSSYRNMHDNLATQGFVIVDDKQSTFEAIPEIDSQRAAIDWVVEKAQDPASEYFGKLDETRIAIGGHSLGSVASFGNVADSRITTSVHMAGGVTDNPGGVDNSLIEELRVPTLFLCGSRDTNGLGRVRSDYAAAPDSVPLFFGILDGVGHTDEFNRDNGGRWGRIVAAWLRSRLAYDQNAAALFSGVDCEFCGGDWTAMKRNLD